MTRFAVGPAAVDVDDHGRVRAVGHRSDPGRDWLAALDLGPVVVDGTAQAWRERSVVADVDEVEVTADAGPLRVLLRHSFAAGWTTRLAVWSTGGVDPDGPGAGRVDVALHVRAGDTVAWRIATGVDAVEAFLPPGTGAVLLARLTAGSAVAIDGDGWSFGPLDLSDGRRWVAQLRWDWAAFPRAVSAALPAVVPRRTVLALTEALTVTGDPDAAVVVEPARAGDPVAAVTETDGARVVVASGSGRHRLAVHTGRGTTAVDVAWAAPPADLLGPAAEAALAGPRTRSHVPLLPDLPAALVVQHALRTGGLPDAYAAGEALELFAARAADRVPEAESALLAVFLLGEHERSGEDEALGQAEELVATAPRAAPGLGLAAVRLWVAGAVAGRSWDRAAVALGRLATRTVAAGPLDRAGVELALAVGPLVPGLLDRVGAGPVCALVRAVGAGLPGAAASAERARAEPLARAAAVLRLVPPALAEIVRRDSGTSAETLADRAVLAASVALAADRAGEPASGDRGDGAVTWAHAWLALADRTV